MNIVNKRLTPEEREAVKAQAAEDKKRMHQTWILVRLERGMRDGSVPERFLEQVLEKSP